MRRVLQLIVLNLAAFLLLPLVASGSSMQPAGSEREGLIQSTVVARWSASCSGGAGFGIGPTTLDDLKIERSRRFEVARRRRDIRFVLSVPRATELTSHSAPAPEMNTRSIPARVPGRRLQPLLCVFLL